MSRRYNVPRLRAIYGRTAPPDPEAIIELRLWRRRADGLVSKGHVVDGLLLIEAVSNFMLAYRKSGTRVLAMADRAELFQICAVAGVFEAVLHGQ